LYRYNPELAAQGGNPFRLDSRPPTIPLEKYIYNEGRYNILVHYAPETAALLLAEAQRDVELRWKLYQHWASVPYSSAKGLQA
jgi:pyruvate-ferredoxin/flavodoxin oxidoreductase